MNVAVIPIVTGALGTILKGLEGGWKFGNWRSSRNHTASARILRIIVIEFYYL